MADTNELKPCPCGKTPDRLGISDGSQGGKYHFVAGDCCSEWMIEFRANYKPIESNECMALAVAAWNASPRALVAIREATPQPADAALVGKLRHQLAQVTDECARLRALSQPAVPPALVTAALGTGGGEKLFVPVHIAVEAAHIAARGQHAAAIEYAHRYAQPAAPVAQVPEGFVLCEIGVLSESFLDAAIRDADHVRNICEDLDVVLSAGIHAYLLAASKAAAPSAKGEKE